MSWNDLVNKKGLSIPDVDMSMKILLPSASHIFVLLVGAQVLVADSDDEVVDHASLLNSFGNDNTNIITPVPRMHSIKPEWDEDVSVNLAPSIRLFGNRWFLMCRK